MSFPLEARAALPKLARAGATNSQTLQMGNLQRPVGCNVSQRITALIGEVRRVGHLANAHAVQDQEDSSAESFRLVLPSGKTTTAR